MIKRRVQGSLAVLAIVFTCFVLTIQTEQYSAFAHQQGEQKEKSHKPELSSNIGEIQLHPFTLWELWKIATLAYINPLALTGKSVIYIYEFSDQASVREALIQIKRKHPEILKENWYVGQVTTEPIAGKSEIWRPSKLNEFNLESVGDEGKQLVASNLRIPGNKNYDAYWVPYDEWAALVEKDR